MIDVRVALRPQPLRRAFRISHTRLARVTLARLELAASGADGWGEIAVGPWVRETPEQIAAAARELVAVVAAVSAVPTVAELDAVLADARDGGCPPSARLLVEMAFLDLAAQSAGEPSWQLLELPRPPVSALWRTLAIGDAPAEQARRTGAAQRAPGREPSADADRDAGRQRYKVKLGGGDDAAVLDALRDRDCELIVDVNSGWDHAAWERLREPLRALRPLALEDPIRVDLDSGSGLDLLAEIRAFMDGVPVVLDESVQALQHVGLAAQVADGANIKLAKLGGLLDSRRALEQLRAADRRRMLGCFLEPPRAIAYAAQLATLADWTDLDGHLWLSTNGYDERALELDSDLPGVPAIVGR